MSRASELLDNLPDGIPMTYSLTPAAEPHIIINSDRSITVPEELKHIAVQGDHNIETVTFDCPRYWDEHDLFAMSMRIVYQRPDGHREQYPVEDLRVDDSDDSTVHFDWTISGNVTLMKGTISFMVCAKISNVEGVREREWHSRINQDLVIDEGMDCSDDYIIEQNPDILESILARLDSIESTGGVTDDQVANAVASYLDENPVQAGATEAQAAQIETNRKDIANKLDKSGWTAGKYLGTDANGSVITKDAPVGTGSNQSGNGLDPTASALLITILRNSVYSTDQSANITTLAEALSAVESEQPDTPVAPDEPETPTVMLVSVTATYSGGDVAVGTAISELTGIVVTAYYSDGSSATVTDYTLSGNIAEGSNTITVSYGGKTTTFTVTGVAESGGDIPADATRLAYIESSGTQYIDTGVKPAFLNAVDFTADIGENVGSQADIFGAFDGTNTAYFRYYQNATVGKFGWFGSAVNFTCADYLGNSIPFRVRFQEYNTGTDRASVKIYKDDTSFASSTIVGTGESTVSAVNLYLFARNNNGTASQFATYKLREFIIHTDSTCTSKIIHLVPVLDPNGVACLYDIVNKQYLRNGGSGNFIAGEVA